MHQLSLCVRTAVSLLPFFLSPAIAQTPAFPGAEGFGKFTTGGRGGAVHEVTNLDDGGPGSLREAVNATGVRTIVFRISGTIYLQSRLTISNSNVTIAGQTAPGDGVCIAGYPVVVDADNVILRFLRFRLGNVNAVEDDALNGRRRANVIIDHCSMTWSVDEASSFYDNSNFTMQWCIVGESLYLSLHDKGAHGYGGIWGGLGATFHHNLIVHNSSRNPRFNGSRYHGQPELELVDFVNNVIYNWGFNSIYGGEGGKHNIRGNYFRPGPATRTGPVSYRILQPYSSASDGYGRFYIADNTMVGSESVTADNWTGGVQSITEETKQAIRSDKRFPVVPVTRQDSYDAFISVLGGAGAVYPRRDSVDGRIVGETASGTVTYGTGAYISDFSPNGIIDSQNDVGGWPVLQTETSPPDDDHDGMPDEWETANGLNPADPGDRNGDPDGDGYTNLEEYLNGLVSYPGYLQAPPNVAGYLSGSNTVVLTWRDESEDETGFRVERAVVDSFQTVATLPVNATTYSDEGLADFTTFRYRVIAFSDSLTSGYTDELVLSTLSVTSPPLASSDPMPVDGAVSVWVAPKLHWKAGLASTRHDVFIGMDSAGMSLLVQQADTSYQLDTLQTGTTYYWRVDEVNGNGTTVGAVWAFTTRTTAIQEPSIVWAFDEGSGRSTASSGTHTNLGTLTNMASTTWTTGIGGGALDFDGIDDHVYVPHHASLDFGGESFSIAFILKPGPLLNDGSSRYALHKGSFIQNLGAGRSGRWYGFEFKTNALQFSIDDNAVKSTVAGANVGSLLSSDWNYVVGVRDSAAGQLRLYVNGNLLGTAPDGTGDIAENEPLYFGNNADRNGAFSGLLDEVRYYPYALTDPEVAALSANYQTSVPEPDVNPSSFVLYQNFPNPFNPETRLRYILPVRSDIRLTVHSMLGEEIVVLEQGVRPAGSHSVTWFATGLSSGVYFYRLDARPVAGRGEPVLLRGKMLLVR